jgi:hypothetical protein
MLIWINGPFGVGKTTVARRLVRLRPDFRLFDPEQIGFMLRPIWPASEASDFRDLPLWRELVLRTLAAAASDPARTIVVPMSLSNPDYFEEIIGGLRAQGIDVRHFSLMAPAATIRRRIWRRLSRLRSKRWALVRVEPCLAILSGAQFAAHIAAHERPAAAIAEEILARLSNGMSSGSGDQDGL